MSTSSTQNNTSTVITRAATKKLLEDSIIRCKFGHTDLKFLPNSSVKEIATHEAIYAYIREDDQIGGWDEFLRQELASEVHEKAQRLFILAVIIGWPAINLHSLIINMELTDGIIPMRPDAPMFPKYDDENNSMRRQIFKEQIIFWAANIECKDFEQLILRSSLPFTSVKKDHYEVLAPYPDGDAYFWVDIHRDCWNGPELEKSLVMTEFEWRPENIDEDETALAGFWSDNFETERKYYILSEDIDRPPEGSSSQTE